MTTITRRLALSASTALAAVVTALAVPAAASSWSLRAPDDARVGWSPVTVLSTTATDSMAYAPTQPAGVGQVIVNMTNFGFLGTNYKGRGPSFVYPATSNPNFDVDHLVRGGLWIGAFNPSTGKYHVSTGTLDGQVGTAAAGQPSSPTYPEWTPHGYPGFDAAGRPSFAPFLFHSNLDPNDLDATSEQDIITRYSDGTPYTRSNHDDHVPLVQGGLQVSQRSLSWSFEGPNKYVIMEYTMKNPLLSGEPLDSVFVGLYSELVTTDKGSFATFPPPGGALFAMKDIAYYDSLNAMSEHHSPLGGGFPSQWAGMKFLGATAQDTVPGVKPYNTFHWFTYDTGDTLRDTDTKRYRILANPIPTDATHDESTQLCARTNGTEVPCDPVNVIAHGPFRLAPGESLVVTFAFLGGDDFDSFVANAQNAQHTYDLHYKLPQPPPPPGVVVTPGLGELTVRWANSPESFRDRSRSDIPSEQLDFEGYRVYISEDNGAHFNQVLDADRIDSLGFNTGLAQYLDAHPVPYRTVAVFDSATGTTIQRTDSTTYVYTIRGLKNGFRYIVVVTAYDIGDPLHNALSLESGISTFTKQAAIPGPQLGDPAAGDKVVVFPNPYNGSAAWDGQFARDKAIWFANLPKRCTIKIYTTAGDLVQTIPFDASTYHAENARVFAISSSAGKPPVLSGTMAAWNMISRAEQEIGSGLYMFSVTDLDAGTVSRGNFVVVK